MGLDASVVEHGTLHSLPQSLRGARCLLELCPRAGKLQIESNVEAEGLASKFPQQQVTALVIRICINAVSCVSSRSF